MPPLNSPSLYARVSRYPVAVRYLAAQGVIAGECLDLVCYLYHVSGPQLLRDIGKAKRGETLD